MASRVSGFGTVGSDGSLAAVAPRPGGELLTETEAGAVTGARPLRGAHAGPPLLSTLPATPAEHRLALGKIVVSAVVFAAPAAFAKTPLAPLPAFLPAYQSALVLNDLVTVVLLLGQFSILRSRAL